MRIKALVVRILAPLRAFSLTDTAPDDLGVDHRVLGIYNPGDPEERILITETGVLIRSDDQWLEIPFAAIAEVRSPSDKERGRELIILLKSGTTKPVIVAGHHDGFRDVYEFGRFLERARMAMSGSSNESRE